MKLLICYQLYISIFHNLCNFCNEASISIRRVLFFGFVPRDIHNEPLNGLARRGMRGPIPSFIREIVAEKFAVATEQLLTGAER